MCESAVMEIMQNSGPRKKKARRNAIDVQSLIQAL